MARACIFPGQGSQAVGMGKALAEHFPQARAVFEEVDEALGQPLSRLMFEGPAEELTLTANAQPALMAASLAALRVLEAERGLDLEARRRLRRRPFARRIFGAGRRRHLLASPTPPGCCASAATPCRRRWPAGAGAMAALIGADAETAQAIAAEAAEGAVCEVANDNGGGQVVLSGDKAAVERAVALAQARGVKRAVLLNVSAPFHCALMAPAADAMREALGAGRDARARGAGLANVLAAPAHRSGRDPRGARRPGHRHRALARDASPPWRPPASTSFFEIGAGKVLTGLVKRIAAGAVGERRRHARRHRRASPPA